MEKMKTTHSSLTIEAQGGVALAALVLHPAGPCKGTVVLNAATGVKKEYYLKFGNFLTEHAYRVILYDYRGIGGSQAPGGVNRAMFMHEWGLYDMNAVLEHALQQYPSERLLLIGHSIGGQLVGFLNKPGAVEKVLMLNASTGYWQYLAKPYGYLTYALWKVLTGALVPLVGYAPFKQLNLGENLPAGVAREWAAWCTSRTYFRSTLEEKLGRGYFPRFTNKVKLLYPTDDYIATERAVQHLLEFYPYADIEKISVSPSSFHAKKIGHFGFFKKELRHKAWPLILKELED